ncbi:hypothetical protein ACIBI3_07980 [Actinomadura luteofluorescens]|uniref:hypothetical protein n=1 Tax=Actinomadura luteofluorescens TaxID=46163 RepID=UPI0034751DED
METATRQAPPPACGGGGMSAAGQVLLGEYQALKAEQNARIVARDNLIYATLGAFAATAVAIAGLSGQAKLVLLLPPACVVFGWTYLVNDQKVSAIGRYLRAELGPRLARTIGADAGEVLRWETVHRSGRGRRSGKRLQLAVDLATFVLPAMLAVAGYWSAGPREPALIGVSAAETLALAVLAVRIVLSADLAAEGP